MSRHYGNLISGSGVIPNYADAFGVWSSPTEVFRQRSLYDGWPVPTFNPSELSPPLVGSFVLALSSGAADTAVSTNSFVYTSGQLVSSVQYPELSGVIGSLWGASGSLIRTPPCSSTYTYFKTTTTSGLTAVQTSGVAVLANHTHTAYRANTNAPTAGLAAGGRNRRSGITTSNCGHTGGAGNRGKSIQAYPLLTASGTTSFPFGCVVPVSIPLSDSTAAQTVVAFGAPNISSVVVCSGQPVSRVSFSETFKVFGTLFGSGDGSTTFNLPDLRGVFLENTPRDQVAQVSGGSSFMPASFLQHTHIVSNLQTVATSDYPGGGTMGGPSMISPETTSGSFGAGTETRGQNVSVLYCIRQG